MRPAAAVFFMILAALAVWSFGWLRRQRARERLFDEVEPAAPVVAATLLREQLFDNWLHRWLFLAGFRSPGAASLFVTAELAGIALGAVCVVMVYASGIIPVAVHAAGIIPGGVGDLALPILYGAPWISAAFFVLAPVVYVRARRRRREDSVEIDLPLALEMLATLSEAGLGFDAGLVRIMDSQNADRPLVQEFQTYQSELLAGVSRIQALRHIRHRLDVPSVTVFISALVQSEHSGSGLTDVLRKQAEDARSRQRQRALIKAEALPTKLTFPLVICYMPGLFAVTLGPALLQFIHMAESFGHRQ